MINWPIVLGAFFASLTLVCYLVARKTSGNPGAPSQPIGRLLGGLSVLAGFATIGLWVSGAAPFLSAAPTTPTPSPSSLVLPDSSSVLGPPASVTYSSPVSSTALPSSFLFLPSASPTPPANSVPPRLQIPSLDIDESIQTIPIYDGEWDLTNLGMEIGWLTTTGARPGDEWAMVFIGHMTVSAKEPGPFAYLQKIKKDAEVIYQTAETRYLYHVESISRAGPFDVNRLYLADGDSLLLITCTDWDATQQIYTNRLVVQARLETVIPAKDEDFGL